MTEREERSNKQAQEERLNTTIREGSALPLEVTDEQGYLVEMLYCYSVMPCKDGLPKGLSLVRINIDGRESRAHYKRINMSVYAAEMTSRAQGILTQIEEMRTLNAERGARGFAYASDERTFAEVAEAIEGIVEELEGLE